MFVWIKTKRIKLEQYWLSSWLHLILLYETKKHIQSDSFNEWSLNKIFDTIPKTSSYTNKKDNEIIELKAKQLAVLESAWHIEHNTRIEKVLIN